MILAHIGNSSVLAGHFFFGNRNSGVVQFGFVPSCSIMWACVLVKVLLLELSIFFVKSNAQLGVMNNSGMRFFNEGIGFINKVTISEVKNNIKIIAIFRAIITYIFYINQIFFKCKIL